ncbi:MAG: response regulator [Kofleriaceae bacterium]
MNKDAVKVLLVDDTPANLTALEALLRRSDIDLVSARSGAEALEHCLVQDFSLALIDVQMPEMDGFELAELMRGTERTKTVPIIFVTAGPRDQERTFKGYETGAVDFLYKPIDPQILSSKVNVFVELAQQRRQLVQALQLNEMFVGILGHDLRNPLSALVAGIELLTLRLEGDRNLEALGRMRSSARRMQSMINELLDLTSARLGPGLGLARARQQVDLRELLSRAIDELRVVHKREFVFDGPESCITTGDPDRLLQLFSNLLGNAITLGSPDTPVTVRVARCEQEAVVEVHIHGQIPGELVSTLFEPFRGSRNRSGGLGLGLFIAREIARAHGGEITLVSSDGSGTLFAVKLPQNQAATIPVSRSA